MTRFRQLVLSLVIALALLVPFAGVASADPIDPGTTYASSSSSQVNPGRGGGRPDRTTTSSDPIDPGTTY